MCINVIYERERNRNSKSKDTTAVITSIIILKKIIFIYT